MCFEFLGENQMRLLSILLATIVSFYSLTASASEKVKGDLYSRKFSAHTHYVIDQEAGFIGVYTNARALFMPIKDTRTFNVEPEYLLSDVIKDLEVGEKYSLDIKSDSPRYEAKLISIDHDKNKATVHAKDHKGVIDLYLVLDLSKEVVDIKGARITLLKVGGVSLDVGR